jgi:hypothetical protein
MHPETGYLRIATEEAFAPPEYVPEEVTLSDQIPLDAAAKKAFFQGIAEQVFGLLPDRSC